MSINREAELTKLRRLVLTMAANVEQRVKRAMDAVLHGDTQVASQVRHGDDDIDLMEIDTEKECLRILALSQPVAGDLRLVLAVSRITTDLERMGDMAKGIAKRALHLEEIAAPKIPEVIREMSVSTIEMLGRAIEALANEDVTLARDVLAQDQRVDELQKAVFVWSKDAIMQDPDQTEACIDMLSIARKLERIADLSTNISEEVIFLVEGKVTKHADARPVGR